MAALPGVAAPTPAARAARILILIGLILQVIEVAVLVVLGSLLLVVPAFSVILLPLAGIGILWIVLVYWFSYRRVVDGDYVGANAPTFVFAILSLVTANLISGILYVVAYLELSKAESEQSAFAARPYYANPAWGVAPAPTGSPPTPLAGMYYCRYCGRPNPASARFCASCGAGLA